MRFGCIKQLYSHVPIKNSKGVKSGKDGGKENGPLLPSHLILKKEIIFKFREITKNIVLNKYSIFLLKLDTLYTIGKYSYLRNVHGTFITYIHNVEHIKNIGISKFENT